MLPKSPSGQEVQSQVLPDPLRMQSMSCPRGVRPQRVWEVVSGTVWLLLVGMGEGCATRASTQPVEWKHASCAA